MCAHNDACRQITLVGHYLLSRPGERWDVCSCIHSQIMQVLAENPWNKCAAESSSRGVPVVCILSVGSRSPEGLWKVNEVAYRKLVEVFGTCSEDRDCQSIRESPEVRGISEGTSIVKNQGTPYAKPIHKKIPHHPPPTRRRAVLKI